MSLGFLLILSWSSYTANKPSLIARSYIKVRKQARC